MLSEALDGSRGKLYCCEVGPLAMEKYEGLSKTRHEC